jgi:hypothetical protein
MLGLSLAAAQFIAYVTLTVTGLIVAFTSLRFTYRQNFGWPPIFMVVAHGLKSGGKEKSSRATFSSEFWNRCTYPLVVRHCRVNLGTLNIDPFAIIQVDEDGWSFDTQSRGHMTKSFVVKPGEHLCISCCPTLKEQSLDAIKSNVEFQILYYDPRRHKVDTMKVKHLYSLGR